MHLHLHGLLGELLHDFAHLLRVHGFVDLAHDTVSAFETVQHRLAHASRVELELNRLELRAHDEALLDLLALSDQVLRKDLRCGVLVLLRQGLDFLEQFSFGGLCLRSVALDVTNGLPDDSFVLLDLLFGVQLCLFVSHFNF